MAITDFPEVRPEETAGRRVRLTPMFAGRRTSPVFVVFGSIAVSTALGCAGAREVRYVYQDGHSGVIGMPANTSQWPTYYRKHADQLMEKHFPEGYEVVRAEEVIEGSRTLTVNGSIAAEIQPSASSNLLAVGKLGRTKTRSQADSLKIKECRILYRKAERLDPQAQLEYAEQAMWTPAPYIDPNASDRKLARTGAGEPKPAEPTVLAKEAAKTGQGAGVAPLAGPAPLAKTDGAVLETSRMSKSVSVSP